MALLSNCQVNNYRLYKEVIDKPKLDISDYADFISDKVEENSIKSIKAYKYNDGEINFISEDSIIEENNPLFYFLSLKYNKKGQLIQLHQMFESYSKPKTYTFTYNSANQLAYQTFSYNGYDTIYHIYYYNNQGDLFQEIQLNNRRSELNGYVKHEINYNQNNIKSTIYDYGYDTLLLFKWHKSITFKKRELIKTSYRILVEDTNYNRFKSETVYRLFNEKIYISSYKAEDESKQFHYTFHPSKKIKSIISGTDTIIYNPFGDKVLQTDKYYRTVFNYEYDSEGNWKVRKSYQNGKLIEVIKRFIEYYSNISKEENPDFKVSESILTKADSLCNIIPKYASEKQLKISNRKKDIEVGDYGKSIEIVEGRSLSDFLPKHWTLISSDTGYLSPYKSNVIIAAFNTSIPSTEQYEFLRCLAIFEKIDDILYLKEQYNYALNQYSEGQPEAKGYTVEISDNMIQVFYQYMRGESIINYEYDVSVKDWRLVSEYSSHRTCCVASSTEYDYKTGKIHISESGMADYEYNDYDTTIYLEQIKNKKIYLKDKNFKDYQSDTLRIYNHGLIYY